MTAEIPVLRKVQNRRAFPVVRREIIETALHELLLLLRRARLERREVQPLVVEEIVDLRIDPDLQEIPRQ